MATISTSREMALWGGSFLIVAILAIAYCGAPLVPVAVAGATTLFLTIIRRVWTRRKTLHPSGRVNND